MNLTNQQNVGVVRTDFLRIAELVAREKNIDREFVFLTMEEALQRVAKIKYGEDHDIRVSIERTSCKVVVYRYRKVVEEVENTTTELLLKDAQRIKPDAKVGDEIIENLPPIDFNHVTAIGAKQVLTQRMRELEQEKQYNEFKDRIGEIVSGIVKRVEFGNVIVDLSLATGLLRRSDLIPREVLKRGDRIRCYIEDVRQDARGTQIVLSRIHPQFMVKLFTQEVPEIYEGIVEIKGCTRDPGSRAKMSVYTSDPSLDPVGACIGMRGSRVQAVTQELQGERVDILKWSTDPATYVVNALSPIEVSKVILEQEDNSITIVVSEELLSKAIGRRGQNIRLASDLTEFTIKVISEEKEAESRQLIDKQRIELFVEALDVDEVLAHLFVAEGIKSLEDLVNTTEDSLFAIEGLSEDLVSEILIRANSWLKQEQQKTDDKLKELGIDMKLEGFCGLTKPMLIVLADIGVKTMEDLAGLAVDEVVEKDNKGPLGELGVSVEDVGGLILEARHSVGWITLESNKTEDSKDESTESEPELKATKVSPGPSIKASDAKLPSDTIDAEDSEKK